MTGICTFPYENIVFFSLQPQKWRRRSKCNHNGFHRDGTNEYDGSDKQMLQCLFLLEIFFAVVEIFSVLFYFIYSNIIRFHQIQRQRWLSVEQQIRILILHQFNVDGYTT